jgi:radical SAM protein with 4Fe4S-binding SPASM domain
MKKIDKPMSEKTIPRSKRDKRRKLEEVLPLEQPFFLFLDPTNTCNIKCLFCPINYYRKNGGKQYPGPTFMAYEKYCETIDSLSDFNMPLELLKLYNHGEPLIHPRFSEMVQYAKRSGNVNKVETVTNGVLLTKEKVDAIIDAGIDKIQISLNGLSSDQFKVMTQTSIDFHDYFKNLQYLYANRKNCNVVIKVVEDLFETKHEMELFCQIFSSVADSLEIESCLDWPEIPMADVANNELQALRTVSTVKKELDALLPDIAPDSETPIYYRNLNNKDDKLVCPNIFYTMAINATGTVSICCADNANQLLCGNIFENRISEIWHSKKLFDYRMAHLLGNRNQLKYCRDCVAVKYFFIDNIDNYRNLLIDRYKKEYPEYIS